MRRSVGFFRERKSAGIEGKRDCTGVPKVPSVCFGSCAVSLLESVLNKFLRRAEEYKVWTNQAAKCTA